MINIKEIDMSSNKEFLNELLNKHQKDNSYDIDYNDTYLSYAYYESNEYIGGYVATKNNDIIHLNLLTLNSEYRGKEIGTLLIKHLIDKAKEMKATRITLSTMSFQAKDFYLKQGFKVFGMLEDTPISGVSKYYLTMKF